MRVFGVLEFDCSIISRHLDISGLKFKCLYRNLYYIVLNRKTAQTHNTAHYPPTHIIIIIYYVISIVFTVLSTGDCPLKCHNPQPLYAYETYAYYNMCMTLCRCIIIPPFATATCEKANSGQV